MKKFPARSKPHTLLSESGMPLRIESSLSENLASGIPVTFYVVEPFADRRGERAA